MLLGCKSSAPIHTWRPPRLCDVGQTGIALMDIEGPEAIAKPLTAAMLAATGGDRSAPTIAGLAEVPQLIGASTLRDEPTIQLVSTFEAPPSIDRPSDLAIASAARSRGIPYLLNGQILQSTGRQTESEALTVSWRLTSLDGDVPGGGMPVHVDQTLIAQKYPQLMSVADPQERLRQACVIETFGLLSAQIDREMVELRRPTFMPSPNIRRGIELAEQGNWPAAESIWMAVLKRHPRVPAAWINASIAAAARQDFETAKSRATEAIRLSVVSPASASAAQETLVWIEMRQRDYHTAFGLPDPPGGWRVSR